MGEVAVGLIAVAGHAVLIMGGAMAILHEVVDMDMDMACREPPNLSPSCLQRNNNSVDF